MVASRPRPPVVDSTREVKTPCSTLRTRSPYSLSLACSTVTEWNDRRMHSDKKSLHQRMHPVTDSRSLSLWYRCQGEHHRLYWLCDSSPDSGCSGGSVATLWHTSVSRVYKYWFVTFTQIVISTQCYFNRILANLTNYCCVETEICQYHILTRKISILCVITTFVQRLHVTSKVPLLQYTTKTTNRVIPYSQQDAKSNQNSFDRKQYTSWMLRIDGERKRQGRLRNLRA